MRTPLIPPELHSWTMSDGYVLRGRLWRPVRGGTGRGVLYLHGIQSHGGWFEWSASLIAAGGNAVLLADRRGSGLNTEAHGDTPSADRWLEDVGELSDWLSTECGVTQRAMVGVSWGGKLAAAWALRYPERVRHLLMIAPGLFPAVDVGLARRIHIGVSLLARPTLPVPIPLDDPALFTQDAMGQAFIANDNLKLTHATARFFYESSRLDHRLVRSASGTLRAKTTLVLAGCDRIIRNAPTVAWLTRIAEHSPAIHTFSESAHTLEFEPKPDDFGRLVERWGSDIGE